MMNTTTMTSNIPKQGNHWKVSSMKIDVNRYNSILRKKPMQNLIDKNRRQSIQFDVLDRFRTKIIDLHTQTLSHLRSHAIVMFRPFSIDIDTIDEIRHFSIDFDRNSSICIPHPVSCLREKCSCNKSIIFDWNRYNRWNSTLFYWFRSKFIDLHTPPCLCLRKMHLQEIDCFR